MRVMQCGHARCAPMGARGFTPRGHGHGENKRCVWREREREKTPILYKRVLLYSHFRSRPVWGRGCPPPATSTTRIMSSTWASVVPAGKVPKDTAPTTSTASLPVLARRFRADLREVGLFEGLGLDSWKLGPASRTGREHLRGSSPVQPPQAGSWESLA